MGYPLHNKNQRKSPKFRYMTVQSNSAINDLQNTIEELTRELLQLRLEVTELRRQSTTNDAERQPTRSSRRTSRPVESATDLFSVGDLVEITNNRNGLRGSRGRVISVTREQVRIDIPQLRNPVRRKYTNVRLIETAASDSSNASNIEQ